MADLDTYEAEPRDYADERDYPRERSRSPGPDRDGDSRIRDEPNGRGNRDGPSSHQNGAEEEEASNPGSNLFVTGIHPRLNEDEVAALFEKYGQVEKCNIMRDPHTRESRGFGFVKMVTTEGADAAKDALQGENYEGRTLSIEKARRARPRTPTPGKYFGPPKRGPPGRPGARDEYDRGSRGGYRDRYDDRGYGRRDDYRREGGGGGGGYRDRYNDRRYDDRSGGYGGRGGDDYASRGGDRYGSGREDRYGGERRGGGGGGGSYGYDRAPRGPPADRAGYSADAAGTGSGSAPAPREYEERRRYD